MADSYGVSLWGDENISKLTVMMAAHIGEYAKKH